MEAAGCPSLPAHSSAQTLSSRTKGWPRLYLISQVTSPRHLSSRKISKARESIREVKTQSNLGCRCWRDAGDRATVHAAWAPRQVGDLKVRWESYH